MLFIISLITSASRAMCGHPPRKGMLMGGLGGFHKKKFLLPAVAGQLMPSTHTGSRYLRVYRDKVIRRVKLVQRKR